ncbi:hypothetical protein CMV_018714 [Castanea mollissima]|uniref:Uncharacterized protein n=1 Tax=Castanea mollissima TaxID=60419 RepID=A0A8J4QUF8_9ROSI|nr:hypothetical protein CMV_018714 [Castanea mollissima]
MVQSGHLAASITHFQQWKKFLQIWLLWGYIYSNGTESANAFQMGVETNMKAESKVHSLQHDQHQNSESLPDKA